MKSSILPDLDREDGLMQVAAEFKKKCDDNGFYTVSEKDEFETLYPDGVRKEPAK